MMSPSTILVMRLTISPDGLSVVILCMRSVGRSWLVSMKASSCWLIYCVYPARKRSAFVPKTSNFLDFRSNYSFSRWSNNCCNCYRAEWGRCTFRACQIIHQNYRLALFQMIGNDRLELLVPGWVPDAQGYSCIVNIDDPFVELNCNGGRNRSGFEIGAKVGMK